MYRRRRRYGRLAWLLGLAFVLFQRRRFRRAPLGSPFGWRGFARDFAYMRYPVFTPTGLALRIASRFFRRFRV